MNGLWAALARKINPDELLDRIAFAARQNEDAREAYVLLRYALDDTIPTLEARLRIIDARQRG